TDRRINLEDAFGAAPVRVDSVYKTPYQSHAMMDPHAHRLLATSRAQILSHVSRPMRFVECFFDSIGPYRTWQYRLLDHVVGAEEDRWRDGQPERLGGLEIDDQFERGRSLDRQIGRLRPLQDPVDEVGLPPANLRSARPIGQQHPGIGIAAPRPHTRQTM